LLKSAAHRLDKARRVAAWVGALSPAALLLALHVWLALGHWPVPMRENYSTAAYRAHEFVFLGACLFAIYAAGPLWMLFVALPGRRLRWKTLVCQLAACGLGWLLIWLAVKYDPTNFAGWFAD